MTMCIGSSELKGLINTWKEKVVILANELQRSFSVFSVCTNTQPCAD